MWFLFGQERYMLHDSMNESCSKSLLKTDLFAVDSRRTTDKVAAHVYPGKPISIQEQSDPCKRVEMFACGIMAQHSTITKAAQLQLCNSIRMIVTALADINLYVKCKVEQLNCLKFSGGVSSPTQVSCWSVTATKIQTVIFVCVHTRVA